MPSRAEPKISHAFHGEKFSPKIKLKVCTQEYQAQTRFFLFVLFASTLKKTKNAVDTRVLLLAGIQDKAVLHCSRAIFLAQLEKVPVPNKFTLCRLAACCSNFGGKTDTRLRLEPTERLICFTRNEEL